MFTLVSLYLFFYILILLSIFSLTLNFTPFLVFTSFSLGNFLTFIQKYKTIKYLYLWLFFCLTGLPPVGLFLVKFNIFFFILSHSHILSVCVLFFFFFLNMLFYTQLFDFKNYKKPCYHLVNADFFTSYKNTAVSYSNFTNYSTYYVVSSIVNTLIFLIFTFFFFSDYFLILYFLSVNNKSKISLYVQIF